MTSTRLLDRPAADALRFELNRHTFGGLPIPDFCAFERGINDSSSAVPVLIDGASTADIWTEFQRTVGIINERRLAIASLLSYPTTRISELVSQTQLDAAFELASEYGVPKGVRTTANVARMGFEHAFYDIASRFSFRALTEMDRGQVEQVHQMILEADNRLVFDQVLKPLYNNANSFNDEGVPVYRFWNGDGAVPPRYETNSFDGTESHYLVSGAGVVDSGDVEALMNKLAAKGVGVDGLTMMLLLCNPAEGKEIRKFRSGKIDNNGSVATWDWIASSTAPARLTTEHVEGATPPDDYSGLPIIGSYGGVLVFESYYIPAGYVSLVSTGGPNSQNNPIGFREHTQPALRGLQLVGGGDRVYPLQDAYYRRGCGTGVRRRSNGATMQIKASGSYATPLKYVA